MSNKVRATYTPGNFLSGKRESGGERWVRLGPNLKQLQGISYLPRKKERYLG
jgi:hypothetical protein